MSETSLPSPLQTPPPTPVSSSQPLTPLQSPVAMQQQQPPPQYQSPYQQYAPQPQQLQPSPQTPDANAMAEYQRQMEEYQRALLYTQQRVAGGMSGAEIGFFILIVAIPVTYIIWGWQQTETFYKWSPIVSISAALFFFALGMKYGTSMYLLSLFLIVCSLIVYIVANSRHIQKVTVQDWISIGVSFILCVFAGFIGKNEELYGTVGLALPSICVFTLMFGVMYSNPYNSD